MTSIIPVSTDSLDDSFRLKALGLAGPWPISPLGLEYVHVVNEQASCTPNPRNLHCHSASALALILDIKIIEKVRLLCGENYLLWRTNFFRREAGAIHSGVSWHHDKHFQTSDQKIDFTELGNHFSVILALDTINFQNGIFQFIPASHLLQSADYFTRDTRPYFTRPFSDHFYDLPPDVEASCVQVSIPSGHFCLFHSALLHGSAASEGLIPRTSMVARLVKANCVIPLECAKPEEVRLFC